MSATSGGFYVSTMPKIEAWLRFVSLVIGIAVGVASLVSIIRNQKNKKSSMKKFHPHIKLFALVGLLSLALPALALAQTSGTADASGTAVSSTWQTILSLVIAVVLTARLIVKLTPTPKDDTVLEKIVDFLKHIGLHIDGSK